MLEARAVSRAYRRAGQRGEPVQALDDVSAVVPRGSTTALVGRSGSGKSTLARCLALLERPDDGDILIDGRTTRGLSGQKLAAARRSIQLVVQDPVRAVNPRFTVAEAVTEPLQVAGVGAKKRREKAIELLREAQLDVDLMDRPARRLSGGQLQRLVLARALACAPRALILDEALSGLDLSVRARLIKLLETLQGRHGLTYVLLSHDLSLVAHLADRTYTLEDGRTDRVRRTISRNTSLQV